ITYWTWDFGDGTNTTAYYGDAYHVYSQGGPYNVTLTVTDNFNGRNHTTASLHVDIPPTANFTTAREFGKVGTPLVFDASASNDSDGRIVRYEWTFGDGAGGAGRALTHRYTYPGEYTVRLAVVDEDGFAATTSSDITAVSQPTAAFSVSPNSIHAFENATFTANGSWDLMGSLVYHWDFGDGT